MSTSNKMCAKLRRDAKTSDERRRFPWAPDSEYSQGRTSILSTERGTTSVSTSVDVGWNMGRVRGVAGPREGTREASVATKRDARGTKEEDVDGMSELPCQVCVVVATRTYELRIRTDLPNSFNLCSSIHQHAPNRQGSTRAQFSPSLLLSR